MNNCKFGSHRVIEPVGSLPQAAHKISNDMNIRSNEMLIDVSTLNIDSASFTQIKDACGSDPDKMAKMIMTIVNERGKMQNPVTGSGGMLIGSVIKTGDDFPESLKPGTKIATLVSLSLTPLKIDEILHLSPDTEQVQVKATAVLFESGLYAVLPDDMAENTALSALDVAGAPAQVHKLVKEGDTVCIIGGGKSGILSAYQAKENAGKDGTVIVLEYDKANAEKIRQLNVADHVIVGDATDSLGVYNAVQNITGDTLCDVTINCVNIENTEMSSILITRDNGNVYFFSMATSFTRAALGSEGVGKDITMLIGNGYTKGHADHTLNILRRSDSIKAFFSRHNEQKGAVS